MASITSLSNSNYNASSIYGNRNVLSGLASGMDTESMIENAVSGIKTKIENLYKKRTKVEWQQEAYRSIIDKAVDFNRKYTSYSSKTNLLSQSFFSNAVNTVTNGTYADKVTASGKTSSDIQINSVKQLATAASYTVSGLGGIGGGSSLTSSAVSPSKEIETSNVQGTLSIDYGRYSFDISMDDTVYKSLEEMAAGINEKLGEVNGVDSGTKASDYVEATVKNGKLVLAEKSTVTGSTKGNSVSVSLIGGNISNAMSSEKSGGTTELSLKDGKTLSSTNIMRESLKDKTFSLTLDGVTKSINLSDLANTTTDKDFQDVLTAEVKKAFGNKVSVNFSEPGKDGAFKISFEPRQDGSTLSVSGTAASAMGFAGGDGNFINVGKKISELLGDNLGDVFKPTNRMMGTYDDKISSPQQKTRSDGSTYYVDAKGNTVDKDGFRVDSDGNAIYEFKVNDASIAVTKETTLDSLMNSINSNPDAGVKVSYSKLTNEFKFTATETGANGRIEFGGMAKEMFDPDPDPNIEINHNFADNYGFSLSNGEKDKITLHFEGMDIGLSVTNKTTMQDFADEINMILGGVQTATYNEKTGQLTVTDNETGKEMEFTITDQYGFDYKREIEPLVNGKYTKGSDAVMDVTINGKRFENLSRSTNTFDLDGLTVNVKGTFEAVGKDGKDYEPITFKTSTDTDKIIDTIREFVNDYNAMATELKSAYSTMPAQQTNGSRYEPLTSDQMSSMSDKEIESYEEKAKQGILFGDSTLSSFYSKLLNAITPGGTDGQTLREIGIGTSYSNGMTTINLDEDKLRAALENDPDKVKNAFTKTREGGAASNGLMQTMQNALNTYVKDTGEPKGALIVRAGSVKAPTTINSNSLQTQMNSIDKEIQRWQNKMSDQIDRYTTKFSRLEQLIAEMNSQASAFSGFMGGQSGY